MLWFGLGMGIVFGVMLLATTLIQSKDKTLNNIGLGIFSVPILFLMGIVLISLVWQYGWVDFIQNTLKWIPMFLLFGLLIIYIPKFVGYLEKRRGLDDSDNSDGVKNDIGG